MYYDATSSIRSRTDFKNPRRSRSTASGGASSIRRQLSMGDLASTEISRPPNLTTASTRPADSGCCSAYWAGGRISTRRCSSITSPRLPRSLGIWRSWWTSLTCSPTHSSRFVASPSCTSRSRTSASARASARELLARAFGTSCCEVASRSIRSRSSTSCCWSREISPCPAGRRASIATSRAITTATPSRTPTSKVVVISPQLDQIAAVGLVRCPIGHERRQRRFQQRPYGRPEHRAACRALALAGDDVYDGSRLSPCPVLQEAAHQPLDFVPHAPVQVQLRHGLCVEHGVRRIEPGRPVPTSPAHGGVAGVDLALSARMNAPKEFVTRIG